MARLSADKLAALKRAFTPLMTSIHPPVDGNGMSEIMSDRAGGGGDDRAEAPSGAHVLHRAEGPAYARVLRRS